MDRRTKNYLLWALVSVFGLLVIIYLAHILNQRTLSTISSSRAFVPEPVSKEMESITPETIKSSAKISKPRPFLNEHKSTFPKHSPSVSSAKIFTPEPVSSVSKEMQPATYEEMNSSVGISESMPILNRHEIIPINAPMTDEQILQNIEQQKQKDEALEQVFAKRDIIADRIRHDAIASQNQPVSDQEATSQDTPQDTVTTTEPDIDTIKKLKSQQLVAH